MQIEKLKIKFDQLQNKYGEPSLNAIYGAGCINNPKLCLVFMNPTARNISCQKNWSSIKAPWIGTKRVWKMLGNLGLFPNNVVEEIYKQKGSDWTEDFANYVYENVSENELYITNLAKCTQIDARPLQNSIFREYLNLMYEEIEILNPQKIITFGNQVSSIFLQKNISVSQIRKKPFELKIKDKIFKTFPVYYPVGQGTRNIGKAIEDIEFILSK